MKLYANLTEEEKQEIYLIPKKYVTSFNFNQIKRAIENEESEELENRLQEAYAVHYFSVSGENISNKSFMVKNTEKN